MLGLLERGLPDLHQLLEVPLELTVHPAVQIVESDAPSLLLLALLLHEVRALVLVHLLDLLCLPVQIIELRK